MHTAGFQAFSHHLFHKKNMFHLSHILKQKLDIVTSSRLSIGIWPKYQKNYNYFVLSIRV